jgi:acetylornithine deacetylase
LALLEQLIALPSVNPAFAPAGDPQAGEQQVAEFLARIAREAGRPGLSVTFQPVRPGRANVLLRLRPSGAIRHRVVLAPHMDTVGVASPEGFRPRRRGGRLHGRGACDTKGSLAAMLAALLATAQAPGATGTGRATAAAAPGNRRPHHTEILLAALIDEESMQAGSRHLARSGLQADLAIVGEPTELQVITAHKGDLWLELSTRGKAAHGARPELGVNAVHRMARVVELLETDYAAGLRAKRHPLLGPATVNVGMISGGRQPNIVPDHCSIRIDRRTIPGESDLQVKREIVHFLRQHQAPVRLVDTKLDEPAPPLETSVELPFVRRFLDAAGQSQAAGVDFFTDAGVLSSAGIPCVVFGPGSIAQAHTADEWIEIRQLERAAALLTRFLQDLP